MKCKHVYYVLHSEKCGDCGRDTHEPDWQLQIDLYKKWIEDGNHLQYKCPIEGGSIRGWTSI